MLKIGLTGGIGVGKSTTAKIFKDLNVHLFDADQVAKSLMENSAQIQNDLMAEFGTDILGKNGKIDRKKLARISFQDEYHQSNLNSIIHPYIFNKIDSEFDRISSEKKKSIFMIDGALIFESGLNTHLDYVIVVTSKFSDRMERALIKGNLNREDILKRIDLQFPCETKIKLADFIIYNDKTEKELKSQVVEIYNQLI